MKGILSIVFILAVAMGIIILGIFIIARLSYYLSNKKEENLRKHYYKYFTKRTFNYYRSFIQTKRYSEKDALLNSIALFLADEPFKVTYKEIEQIFTQSQIYDNPEFDRTEFFYSVLSMITVNRNQMISKDIQVLINRRKLNWKAYFEWKPNLISRFSEDELKSKIVKIVNEEIKNPVPTGYFLTVMENSKEGNPVQRYLV